MSERNIVELVVKSSVEDDYKFANDAIASAATSQIGRGKRLYEATIALHAALTKENMFALSELGTFSNELAGLVLSTNGKGDKRRYAWLLKHFPALRDAVTAKTALNKSTGKTDAGRATRAKCQALESAANLAFLAAVGLGCWQTTAGSYSHSEGKSDGGQVIYQPNSGSFQLINWKLGKAIGDPLYVVPTGLARLARNRFKPEEKAQTDKEGRITTGQRLNQVLVEFDKRLALLTVEDRDALRRFNAWIKAHPELLEVTVEEKIEDAEGVAAGAKIDEEDKARADAAIATSTVIAKRMGRR